jgi:hypothetical protein
VWKLHRPASPASAGAVMAVTCFSGRRRGSPRYRTTIHSLSKAQHCSLRVSCYQPLSHRQTSYVETLNVCIYFLFNPELGSVRSSAPHRSGHSPTTAWLKQTNGRSEVLRTGTCGRSVRSHRRHSGPSPDSKGSSVRMAGDRSSVDHRCSTVNLGFSERGAGPGWGRRA